MLRLVLWFIMMVAAVAGITWLAEHPGTMTIDWLGWRVEDVPVALVLGVLAVALLILWLGVWLVRLLFAAPGAARDYFRLRRRRKGLDALSQGLVALLAGDAAAARRAAGRAARLVPGEPMARLLEARAAQELGEDAQARRLLEEMLADESTEAAALHGLYEQALKSGDMAAARKWAARAWQRHPELPWVGRAMLRFLALDGDWHAVLRLLDEMRQRGLMDKAEHARKKAAALTALALQLEEREPERAIDLALRAHKLDPSLVPAAVLAGGMLAARGKLRKAAKILEKTWKLSPHPDIAEVYAHLRPGDSPRDRLKRVQNLLRLGNGGEEGAVALARAALEARDWETARGALRPWLNENPSARIYILMAELEEKAYGDRGRAREWLARAVRARRDPAWTADGMVSAEWLPVSPVSGELGVFEWRTPVKGDERIAAPEPVPAELLEAPAAAELPPAREAAPEGDAGRQDEAGTADGTATAAAVAGAAGAATAAAAMAAASGGTSDDETAAEPSGETGESAVVIEAKVEEETAADAGAETPAPASDESEEQARAAEPGVLDDAGAPSADVAGADAAPEEAGPAGGMEREGDETGKALEETAPMPGEGDEETRETPAASTVSPAVRETGAEKTGDAPRDHEAAASTEAGERAGMSPPPPGAAPRAPRPEELQQRLRDTLSGETASDQEAEGREPEIVAAKEAGAAGAAGGTAVEDAARPAAEPVVETPEETFEQPPLPDDPGPLPKEEDEDAAASVPAAPEVREGRRWRLFGR
jgi:HemY protein